jgi:hypothetical protein
MHRAPAVLRGHRQGCRSKTHGSLPVPNLCSLTREFAPFFEHAPVNKDPLDVARLCIEEHLAHLVNAWREVVRVQTRVRVRAR